MNQKSSNPYALEYSRYNLPVNFPILGLTGSRWSLPDDDITFLHCHNCLELGFCHKGTGILLVENKTFSFTDDDITIVCPNTMHKSKSTKGTESQWEYLYIDTNRLFREFLAVEVPAAPILMFDSPDFPNIISGKKHPELKQLFLQILNELNQQADGYQLNTACLCISFLLKLLRLLPRELNAKYPSVKCKLSIYPAIQYVENHYMDPLRVEELANSCNLSLTHFRRIFKTIMLESPLDYVNRIRINKSCELLYNTEDTILSIALQIGFSGNTSYNRNFTQLMGTTPLQWRKKVRSIAKNNMEFSIFSVERGR